MMKKILKLASLLVVMVVLLAVAVYADPVPEATIYFDGVKGKTYTPYTIYNVDWISGNPAVASVNASTGVTTALTAGETYIIAVDQTSHETVKTINIHSVARTLLSIKVTTNPTKVTYYSGETLNTAGMIVTNHYNNLDDVPATPSQYTCTPASALTTADGTVTVTSTINNTLNDTFPITVNEVTLNTVTASIPSSSTNAFYTNDAIPALLVSVSYSDGSQGTITSGYEVKINGEVVNPATRKFATTDTSLVVTYRGKVSNTITLTVTDAPPAVIYTTAVRGTLAKTTYFVGETISFSGISVDLKDNNTTVNTCSASELNTLVAAPAFALSDVGANKTIEYTVTYNSHQYEFVLTGITVRDSLGVLAPYSIDTMLLVDDAFKVDHVFSVEDVYYIRIRTTAQSSLQTVYGDDLVRYTDTMSLEVLTKAGARKSSVASRSLISESDINTNSTGAEYVTVRLYIGSKFVDKQVEIERDAVTMYYNNTVVKSFSSLTEALNAAMGLDPDVNLNLFSTRYPLELKLGKDQAASKAYRYNPAANIVIDLNGHNLSFYKDTVKYLTAGRNYSLTITNTSSSDSKFKYTDYEYEVSLGKGEELIIDYANTLPSLFTITVTVGANGKVTADKTITSGKVNVNDGEDIEFKITPNAGYEIDTVKLDSKSVVGSDFYTVKNGVATYDLIDIDKAHKLEVTFKKANVWVNPFKDVSASASYYNDVRFVESHNLFDGTSETTFSPNSTMTRAMFVTVLGRLRGIDLATATSIYGTESEFKDVVYSSSTSWYVPYVAWATKNGLIEGYGDGTFGPNNNITHQQMYLIMKRYAAFCENINTNTTGVTLTVSDKNDIADWALDGVKYASANKFLVVSSTNKITPKSNATRYELAMLLYDFCDNVLDWDVDEIPASK